MNTRKTLSKQMLAAGIAAVCLFTSMHLAASVKLSLSGSGEPSSYGFGSKGFFWDGHFPSNKLNRVYNKRSNKYIGSRNHQDNISGWGIGWRNLSMTLGNKGNHSASPATGGNHSASPATGGGGFTMPHIKYPLVAELHYDGTTGLTFEGWYKNPTTNSWHDIDDEKVWKTENHSQIPEPTSLLLLALGLFGIFVTQVRRKAQTI
jgi:PEP-CTERM motif